MTNLLDFEISQERTTELLGKRGILFDKSKYDSIVCLSEALRQLRQCEPTEERPSTIIVEDGNIYVIQSHDDDRRSRNTDLFAFSCFEDMPMSEFIFAYQNITLPEALKIVTQTISVNQDCD